MPVWTKAPAPFTNMQIVDNGTSVSVNSGISGCNICASSVDNGNTYQSLIPSVSNTNFSTDLRPLYITITKYPETLSGLNFPYIPYSAITGGTLTCNTSFYGILNILSTITVSSGVTLTLAPDVVLKFPTSGCGISVAGTLLLDSALTIPFGASLSFNSGGSIQFTNNNPLIISGTLCLNTNLTIPSGGSLIIGAGGNVQFGPNGSLTVLGNLVLNSNLTIPAGSSLVVTSTSSNPAPTIKMDDNVSIIVQGVMQAQGLPLKKVSFDGIGANGIWGTLTFDGVAARGSILNYVHVNNCAEIQVKNFSDITIQNSRIEYGVNGIYVYEARPVISNNILFNIPGCGIYGSGPDCIPQIIRNTIVKPGSDYEYNGEGITISEGYGTAATGNTVNAFDGGMSFYAGAMAFLDTSSAGTGMPNNLLSGNGTGIGVFSGSEVFGGWGDVWCALNSIHDNDYDAYVSDNGCLFADENYWGSNPNLFVSDDSYAEFFDPLTVDPFDPGNSRSITHGNHQLSKSVGPQTISKNDTKLQFARLKEALKMIRQGKINDASLNLQAMVKSNVLPEHALNLLGFLDKNYSLSCLRSAIPDIGKVTDSWKFSARKVFSNQELSKGNITGAVTHLDQIINNSQDAYEKTDATLAKYFICLHVSKDINAAKVLLANLNALQVTDKELIKRIAIANHQFALSFPVGKTVNKPGTKAGLVIVKDYALSQNYPNPFNPSTTINYQIPNPGNVTIKIYDALGREVRTLVNEEKAAGSYTVSFNGSDLASGLYICTLRSGNFVAGKKMLLIK